MLDLSVLDAGLFTSIQDNGRFGYRRFGVPWSGVLDPDAAQLANVLAGNTLDAPLLEFFQKGPTLQLRRGTLRLAVTGDCQLALQRADARQAFRAWRSVTLQAGDILHVGRVHSSKVGYLALAGDLGLTSVLGSCATYLRAGFGGFDGNLLRTNDTLHIERPRHDGPNHYLPEPPGDRPPGQEGEPSRLRVVLGPQDDYFTAAAHRSLLSEVYTVSRDSDRMGVRLDGPGLEHAPGKGTEIISDALVPGAIQVPGSGAPIVLLADGPTVGGYPKIATVISADLPLLATRMPGSALLFDAVTVEEGAAILGDQRAAQERRLTSIVPLPRLSEPFAATTMT